MAAIYFNKSVLIIFVLFFHLESFFFICYDSLITFNKYFKLLKTKIVIKTLKNYSNTFYFNLFILMFFSLKYSFSCFGFYLFFVLLVTRKLNLMLNQLSEPTDTSFLFIILPTFAVFLILFFFVDSFLTFFFFVELYGVIYYFFFLTTYKFTSQTILQYKNGLLLLLWNNFLTTIFLALGCFFIYNNCGTTNFNEVCLLNTNKTGLIFFLFGLFWKLGLPLFHFFKLEIYKYLSGINVFFFSILTTLINLIIIYLLLNNNFVFSFVYENNWFFITVFLAVVIFLVNLKLYNFFQFIGFSGILSTLTSVIIFFFN